MAKRRALFHIVNNSFYQNDPGHPRLAAGTRTHLARRNPHQAHKEALLFHPGHLLIHSLLRVLSHHGFGFEPERTDPILRDRPLHVVYPLPPQRGAASWRHVGSHPAAQPGHPDDQEVPIQKTLASLVVCALSLLPHLFIFVLSRFILGILNGFHMSLASAFIKEIFPSHIRKPLGAIYSTARILGMLYCYLIAEVSGFTLTEADHIITFMGPAFISILQGVLFWWFMPDSIVEMIAKQEEEQAKRGLTLLYSPELVDRRYQQMKMEISNGIRRTVSFQKIKLFNRKNLCSLHLAMLRQFCGETYIVIYAREIMKSMDSPYANVTPAIINSIQLLAGLLGIIAVQKVSRSKLLVGSCCLLALLNVGIGLTDLYDMPISCLLAMTAFMIPNGIGLSSVAWSYPSELVPASQGKYSSFLNWTCSTMVAMVPPYIVKTTPNEGAYPVFFFFAFYLAVAFLINLSLLSKISRPIDQSGRTTLIQDKE